ncbi:hypothetical protein DID88_003616 [Monilinia fructigena]|uniref:Uncharacterized protein n=1 Tax=Monilinia fructigena TaxID=38457 RepID=A0A395ITH8_9HELO|nr:hypothetical protein DID88_003616 [Monilinia fructigena]
MFSFCFCFLDVQAAARTYSGLNVKVKSLCIDQTDLTTKLVALDEAHKYMSASTEDTLTKNLLNPINPALIDLCSMTIVHRFSSPEWLRVSADMLPQLDSLGANSEDDDNLIKEDVSAKLTSTLKLIDLPISNQIAELKLQP